VDCNEELAIESLARFMGMYTYANGTAALALADFAGGNLMNDYKVS